MLTCSLIQEFAEFLESQFLKDAEKVLNSFLDPETSSCWLSSDSGEAAAASSSAAIHVADLQSSWCCSSHLYPQVLFLFCCKPTLDLQASKQEDPTSTLLHDRASKIQILLQNPLAGCSSRIDFQQNQRRPSYWFWLFSFLPCCWNSSLESTAWRKLTKKNPMWILRSQICKPQDSTRVL